MRRRHRPDVIRSLDVPDELTRCVVEDWVTAAEIAEPWPDPQIHSWPLSDHEAAVQDREHHLLMRAYRRQQRARAAFAEEHGFPASGLPGGRPGWAERPVLGPMTLAARRRA